MATAMRGLSEVREEQWNVFSCCCSVLHGENQALWVCSSLGLWYGAPHPECYSVHAKKVPDRQDSLELCYRTKMCGCDFRLPPCVLVPYHSPNSGGGKASGFSQVVAGSLGLLSRFKGDLSEPLMLPQGSQASSKVLRAPSGFL